MRLKTKLNQKLMVSTLIAFVISDKLPGLANTWFFKDKPVTGIALDAIGAGGAYLAAILLKKPDIASIGVALSGANVINGMLGSVLPTKSATTGTTYNQYPVPAAIDDYVRLSLNDYVGMPTKNINYSKFYE